MKKTLLIGILFIVVQQADAQHFYHRIDIGTNNIYTFVASNLITAGLNAATNDMLFDTSYNYSYLDLSANESVKTKNYDMLGLTARDIFSDVRIGTKLGYQSFNFGAFNWGIYGSVHYKLNQFKTQVEGIDVFTKHNIQKLMLGGGLMMILGSMENNTRVIIEAGLRYDTPLSYKGGCGGETNDMANSGLSSNVSIRFGGTGWLQGLGLYADIPHYNMFKSGGLYFSNPHLKMYSFGIIYTISPWKFIGAYDL